MIKNVSLSRAAFALGITSLFVAANAFAVAVVTETRGSATSQGGALAKDQRLQSGATITTGPGARTILRFDDGQSVLVNENSQFRITDFRYDQAKPAEDRSVFELVRGALRVVSGAIGGRSRGSWQLRTPQATIGIRGTDFMVAIVNPLFMTVTTGTIAATNTAGTVAFGAGTFGTVATSTALATTISAGALPAAVSGSFGSMGSAVMGAAGGATGTAAAGTGGTAGTSGAAGTAGTAGGAAGAAAPAVAAGGAAAAGAIEAGAAATAIGVGAAAAAAAAGGGGGGGGTTTTGH